MESVSGLTLEIRGSIPLPSTTDFLVVFFSPTIIMLVSVNLEIDLLSSKYVTKPSLTEAAFFIPNDKS